MQRIGVIGTGLIGGSIGLGLRDAGRWVLGWDADAAVRAAALAGGAMDEAASSESELLGADVDVVVLAVPASVVIEQLGRIETPALVIDVAGVKVPVLAAAARLDRFVGTHPMAGRELGGIDHASAALFRGAAWVVTPDGADPEDVSMVEQLITALGARPIEMGAGAHDRAVAAVSHLPQVLAAGLLLAAAEDEEAMRLASGSFRDLTRVASSDPALWDRLLVENREAVVPVIREFAARLEGTADLIAGGEWESMHRALSSARELRATLAPPVVAVAVALADRPGELARVGQAFAVSRVDVRDLQLRHGRHGGGGILTVSVRPGEAGALRSALAAEGLELVD